MWVCAFIFMQALVYWQVCKVFPGCIFTQREWWGIPVYIPQLNMPVIAVWAERPAGFILKMICLFHAKKLRPATRTFFLLTAISWRFFSQHSSLLQLLIFFLWELAAGMFHVGVLACVFPGWCISVHWSRSLNKIFWSAQEPFRILVRYSWKMKYITSSPEAQIPDGTKWLEGDSAIFSTQQSPSPAK